MEIAFIIFIASVANTVSAAYASEWISNLYLRRLTVIPPFGLIIFILICIFLLSMYAIEKIKEIWE